MDFVLDGLQTSAIRMQMPPGYQLVKASDDRIQHKREEQASFVTRNTMPQGRVLRQKCPLNQEQQYFKRENSCLLISQ